MGASWVRKRILEDHPHSDIKVYVVWFNMLSGDSREGWDAYLLYGPDARWSSAPPRPISTGATIYATRGKLQKDVLPLLSEGK